MGRRSKKHSSKLSSATPEDEEAGIRRAASIKAVKTWDDVEHDSEDDFDDSRDKVLLGYDKKLAKHDGLSDDESDEEVFGVRVAESDDGSDGDDGAGSTQFYSDEDDDDKPAADDEDGAWGKQKYNYYDADDIGTDTDDDEAAAKEEEEEALRLQKKHLEQLDEGDFIDEFSAQLGVDAKDTGSVSRLVSSVDDSQARIDLDQVSLNMDGSYNISDAKREALEKLPEKQKLRIIQAESPELLSLAADMKTCWSSVRSEIKPILDEAASIGVSPDDHPALAFYTAKYQLLMSYLNNIAVYLVAKASEPEERGGIELRDHPVIGSIVEFRRRLEVMNALQEKLAPLLAMFADELSSGALAAANAPSASDNEARQLADSDVDAAAEAAEKSTATKPQKRSKKESKAKAKAKTQKKPSSFLDVAPASTDSYAELQAMLKKERSSSRRKSKKQQIEAIEDWNALEDGDFGEQDQLDEDDAEDKARAIRRLRHHAKRVAQARSKRENKDKLTGDMDVPYKDRRLDKLRYDDKTAESIRKQADSYGDDLDVDMDLDMDMDMDLDNEFGESSKKDDDYYLQIQKASEQKKADKEASKEARWRMMVEANEAEDAAVSKETKRNVNYQILKNKGMMPRRTKEQRNPRVKRRKRYEQAKKKIGSAVAQVRKLEGNYGGESTGIKSNLARSTRLG
ncbi:hypothetical protein GQ54DRAFT_31172 [Martensiomyces pterosporus]|nr:hypothetical protein GQ54DRAFT_31172 [Martensiomyces pterosporus]